MVRMQGWIVASLLSMAGAASAAGSGPHGAVFVDGNGNGRLDAGEAGVPGVLVWNGRALVRTGRDGRYALPDAGSGIVSVVKPAGWRVPAAADGLPRAWARVLDAAGSGRAIDFALVRDGDAARRRHLDVLVIADPQVKTATQVDWFERDVIATVRDGASARGADQVADLGLVLGDVVDDVPALYSAINAVTGVLGVPWLHVPGNHDVDPDTDDHGSLRSWREVYGPDSLAWEEPEAVFVALDDVVVAPGDGRAYVGGLRPDQFAFLEAWLPTVPADRLLVLAVHVPLFDTAPPGRPETFRAEDRARLFALLQPFPHVLVLSGHRHTQRHYRHGAADGWHGAVPLHEYNVGAASGAFWSGVADAAGIPDATMADATPNGHARLQVEQGGRYRLSWHPARLAGGDPATTAAMALHAPRVLRQGAYPAFGVYANVWMGEDDTRVEFRVDDGAWQPMQRVERADPRLLAENVRDDAADALRGYDRSPEAEPSTHLWRGALPTRLPAGEHVVEVRAFDRWQGEQRATTRYRLETAPAP
jgi:hypothetical protein